MRTTRLLLAAAATAGLIFPLAACSGGGEGGAALDWEDSPLAEYWNAGYDPNLTEEEQQAQWDAQNTEREELIAQCMVDEGFEYKPADMSGTTISFGEDIEWEPEKKEWVEKYGYGIINNPYNEQMANEPQPEESEWVDPNQEYLDSLSASEQEAYWIALYGDQTEMTEAGTVTEDGEEVYEYDWTQYGCQGWADNEVNGGADNVYTQFEDLATRMSDLYTKAEESPELIELEAKWSSCMADAGFDFQKQPEAAEGFYEEVNKIYENMTEEDWADGKDPMQSEEAQEIGKREIKTALADLECRNKTNYNDTRLTIQFKLEEQFIKENKKELDEFKAAQEQAAKG
ncbi:hypothetical protein ACQUSY_10170 [Microbacterium sp. YY-03]|uniref:hypothetical protein n=1 Tax=Microbacterium sp. YY-03 TaxID=3421636 RepID=UPI003D175B13